MLFNNIPVLIESVHDEEILQKDINLSVLRLDKINPIVSGNKLFKLFYYLEEAIAKKKDTIVTFGGAYSNHLAATAYTARINNLKSIGIIRGEAPPTLSHTLKNCEKNGMQLHFLAKDDYKKINAPTFLQTLSNKYPTAIIIPEGGYGAMGCRGISTLFNDTNINEYTHIITAVGTATTLTGILLAGHQHQTIVGIPVLKNLNDIDERVSFLSGGQPIQAALEIWNEYHFGGYAKKTEPLIQFMNDAWKKYSLPWDFVYTAKAFYGVMDKIKNGYFKPKDNILFVHTGGLQGNLSLPASSLLF